MCTQIKKPSRGEKIARKKYRGERERGESRKKEQKKL